MASDKVYSYIYLLVSVVTANLALTVFGFILVKSVIRPPIEVCKKETKYFQECCQYGKIYFKNRSLI